MIDAEERQSIINEAVEKTLLSLPAVVNNLIAEKQTMIKLSREFFETHPELKDHKSIVASVIESIETENPGMPYNKVIEKSTPVIKERIRQVGTVETTLSEKPTDHTLKGNIEINETGNGLL